MAAQGPRRTTYRFEDLIKIRDQWVEQFGPFPEPQEVSEFNTYLVQQKTPSARQEDALTLAFDEKRNLTKAKL